MFVKPAPGLRVFDPVLKTFMPEEGMEVSDTDFYWFRRLRDGDVVQATPVAMSAPATNAATAAADTSKGAKQ